MTWLCRCKCGKHSRVKAHRLQAGNTTSCGCNRGHRLPDGIAARNRLLRVYKRNARARSLEWLISDDHFLKLTKRACHYCGVPPMQEKKPSTWKAVPINTDVYVHNGVDRKNNAEGYTARNAVPCCFICNRAKGAMTAKEFWAWIARLRKQAPPQ